MQYSTDPSDQWQEESNHYEPTLILLQLDRSERGSRPCPGRIADQTSHAALAGNGFPLAVLVVSGTLFTLYVHPAYAQDGSAPAKPTGLNATASDGQVMLTWDDPNDDSITGYVILRRVRVNDTGGDFSELVADTGTVATTYTDDTVAASTTYTYRIKAINEHGTSERSRWFHIDTPAPPVPDQPTGLEATATHDSITLTWEDPQDESITGYVILRRNRDTDAKGHFDELAADTGSSRYYLHRQQRWRRRPAIPTGSRPSTSTGSGERSRWYHIDTPAAPEPAANRSGGPGSPAITWHAALTDVAGESLSCGRSRRGIAGSSDRAMKILPR